MHYFTQTIYRMLLKSGTNDHLPPLPPKGAIVQFIKILALDDRMSIAHAQKCKGKKMLNMNDSYATFLDMNLIFAQHYTVYTSY